MIIIENLTVSQYLNIYKNIRNTSYSLYEGGGGGGGGWGDEAYYLKAERRMT